MIRLVATDLDGTVLGPDFLFRPRTLEAFAAAREAGVRIMFVTGRPVRWVEPVLELFPYRSLGICSNGGVVYDFARNRVVLAETLPVATVLELRERLVRALPSPVFSCEVLGGVHSEAGWQRTNLPPEPDLVQGPLAQTLPADAQVVKFLARDDALEPREMLRAVQEVVGAEASVTHSIPSLPLAEMGQSGLDKGRTLARWCAEQGIAAEEVAAFGDMPNDVAMLQWAGHGYAMASGWPEVIQAVGRTCPPFEEDGVAQVVERLLAAG